jgi:hypothetical protein
MTTMMKQMILGSAAALLAASTAQAADLPVKAKAVEYVKICSLYGAGFYYIPGTDTCIKIGGAIRFDTTFNGGPYDAPFWQGGAGGNNLWTKDYFLTRERINMTTDTRTATEYGVVRTYANMQFDFTQNRESIAGGFTEVDYAFIQFAGFTFGKAVSQFDPQWALTKPYISSGFLAGSNNTTGIPQIAYTARSATACRARSRSRTRRPIAMPASTTPRPSSSRRARGRSPVPSTAPIRTRSSATPTAATTFLMSSATFASIRWGTLHFAAAMHTSPRLLRGKRILRASLTMSTAFAVSGAVEFKNLPTGAGDSLKIEASYAKGAAKYAFTGGTLETSGGGRFAKFDGNTVGFGYVLDGVYSPGTAQIQQSDAWEVSAFYEHYWNPAWRTSLFGNYSHISYGDAGNAMLAAAFSPAGGRLGTSSSSNPGSTAGSITGTTNNFDFGIAQVGTRTAWTPVKNLTLSAEFTYSRLDQNLDGTYTGTATGKPNQAYQIKDQNLYNGSVQILRSF